MLVKAKNVLFYYVHIAQIVIICLQSVLIAKCDGQVVNQVEQYGRGQTALPHTTFEPIGVRLRLLQTVTIHLVPKPVPEYNHEIKQ